MPSRKSGEISLNLLWITITPAHSKHRRLNGKLKQKREEEAAEECTNDFVYFRWYAGLSDCSADKHSYSHFSHSSFSFLLPFPLLLALLFSFLSPLLVLPYTDEQNKTPQPHRHSHTYTETESITLYLYLVLSFYCLIPRDITPYVLFVIDIFSASTSSITLFYLRC